MSTFVNIEDSPICNTGMCDSSNSTGCSGQGKYFQVINLFSELTSNYQKKLARQNLGILDSQLFKWGNITGDLSEQIDLCNFVNTSIKYSSDELTKLFDLKLEEWVDIIDKNKADIFSPNFLGCPTTTTPLLTDNSNRIASTEWVNAKIQAQVTDQNLKKFQLNPEYGMHGDEPINVTLSWEYAQDVDSQTINGQVIDSSIREYTIENVSGNTEFILTYTIGDKSVSNTAIYSLLFPTFYGTSLDYTQCERTISNVFTVDAGYGEYITILVPNGNKIDLAVSSIIGGFNFLKTEEIYGNTYYVYQSIISGLGNTTIEIVNRKNYESDYIDKISVQELLKSKADIASVYTKTEIDKKFESIEEPVIDLSDYYTKQETIDLIPDVSQFITIDVVPTKVSQLENDSGYITSFLEVDPTVPPWAKQPNKPTYTLTELGAEAKGVAKSYYNQAISYIDKQYHTLVDGSTYTTFKQLVSLIQDSRTQVEQSHQDLKSYITSLESRIEDIETSQNYQEWEKFNQKLQELDIKVTQLDNTIQDINTKLESISSRLDKTYIVSEV